MDQSQEILLGHAIFASSEYGYHGYRRIARSISNSLLHFHLLSHVAVYHLHQLYYQHFCPFSLVQSFILN